METIFDAKELRRSGYYKWYAPEELYKEILEKLEIVFEKMSDKVERLENDEKYFAIYVGIAEKQPVIRRIGNHLYNSFSSSSLRKAIRRVYKVKTNDEINDFMDKLKVQFFFNDSKNLHTIESKTLEDNFFVLNKQGNKQWLKKLAIR